MSYEQIVLNVRLRQIKIYLGIFFILIVFLAPNFAGSSFSNTWPILAFVILIVSIFLTRKCYCSSILLIVPFVVFFIISILNAIRFSEYDFIFHIKEIFRNFLYVIVIVFFASFSKAERDLFLEKFLRIIVYYSIFSLILYWMTSYSTWIEEVVYRLYYNIAEDSSNMGYFRSRISLTIGNPNALAFFCSVLFYIFLLKWNGSRGFKMVVLTILMYLLILTFSRTGYVCFIVSLFFYLVFFYEKTVKIIFVICISILFVIFVFNDLFLSIVDRVSYTSLGGREQLWESILNSHTFQDNWFLGSAVIPIGTFLDNDYITILFKFGSLGLMVYLIIMAYLFFSKLRVYHLNLQKRKENFIMLTLMLHLFIFSVTSSVLTSYKISLLLLSLLTLFYIPNFFERRKK